MTCKMIRLHNFVSQYYEVIQNPNIFNYIYIYIIDYICALIMVNLSFHHLFIYLLNSLVTMEEGRGRRKKI